LCCRLRRGVRAARPRTRPWPGTTGWRAGRGRHRPPAGPRPGPRGAHRRVRRSGARSR